MEETPFFKGLDLAFGFLKKPVPTQGGKIAFAEEPFLSDDSRAQGAVMAFSEEGVEVCDRVSGGCEGTKPSPGTIGLTQDVRRLRTGVCQEISCLVERYP